MKYLYILPIKLCHPTRSVDNKLIMNNKKDGKNEFSNMKIYFQSPKKKGKCVFSIWVSKARLEMASNSMLDDFLLSSLTHQNIFYLQIKFFFNTKYYDI